MSSYTRLNISAPKAFVEELKLLVSPRNISKFLVEAGKDKILEERKKEARKLLSEAAPLFPTIKDAAKYVHDLRRQDTAHRMRKSES